MTIREIIPKDVAETARNMAIVFPACLILDLKVGVANRRPADQLDPGECGRAITLIETPNKIKNVGINQKPASHSPGGLRDPIKTRLEVRCREPSGLIRVVEWLGSRIGVLRPLLLP